jgi:Plasmid pRiA4b ORF-3-like protein
VPTSITLNVLHDIIQAVMGWFDYHLWEFTIGKQKYGLPMDEGRCGCATCCSCEKLSSATLATSATSGSIGSRSPMSVLVSRSPPIHASLAAKETDRPRIAVEFRASSNA